MRNFPAQYNLKPNDVLYFCHIPKTAGMTFRTIIEDRFNCSDVCPATLKAQIKKIPPEELQRYRLFRGHLGFTNLPGLLPNKRVINVTVLREPIARVISHYEYIRRMPGDPHYEAVKDMTLEEFAQKLTAGKVGKSIQTYNVAKTARSNFDSMSATEILDLAKTSLDDFAFVGLVERFQDSLFLLSYIFGWHPILNSRRENASKKPAATIPEKTLEVIRENTIHDHDLFQHGKAIFEARFEAMRQDLFDKYGDTLSQPVASPAELTTEQLADLLDRHCDQRYRELQLPTSPLCEYDFCQPLRGNGWQRREYPSDGTTSYRWIGPTPEATLDLPVVKDADLSLELQMICTTATTPDVVDSFQMEANGEPITIGLLQGDQGEKLMQAYIPKAIVQNDRPFVRLKFAVSRTVVLNEINPKNPDMRPVGLAFNHVRLFPVPLRHQYSLVATAFETAPWQEAAEFLRQHAPTDEPIAAPLVFRIEVRNPVVDYAAFLKKGGCSWLVLHKGIVESIDPIIPKLAMQGFAPVFANSVFVIFSTNKKLPKLGYTDPNVKPLYVDYLRRNISRTLKPFWRPFHREEQEAVKSSSKN